MKLRGAVALLCIGIVPVAFSASAETLHVEKDGSGDYTIIQDALDAAAPGDTVLVGPGRFDTFQIRTASTNGFRFQSIAHIVAGDVTLLGSGPGQTVLGPETLVDEIDGLVTVAATIDAMEGSTVSGFAFENIAEMLIVRVSRSTVNDCEFVNHRLDSTGNRAIRVNRGKHSLISSCSFSGPDAIITASGGVEQLRIVDCNFDDPTLDGIAVVIGNGALNCTVRGCTFTRGGGGIQFSFSSSGWVEECTFTDVWSSAIDMSSGAAVVRRSVINPGSRRALTVNNGRLEVYDSVIGSGTHQTIVTWGDLLVRNSHIEPAGSLADTLTVDARTVIEGWQVDLAENWWGTTDTTEIWSAIEDPNSRVTIDPILQGPVPTEKETVGGMKGRYRSPN